MDQEVIDPSLVRVILLYGPRSGFPRKTLPYKSTILNDLDGSKGE